RRHRVDLGGGDRVVEDPLVHVAGVALGCGAGDLVPVGQVAGGGAGADHGRDPQLAGADRGVAGAPAAVGDTGAGALHARLPVWVGQVGDEHLAGLELVHAVDRVEHPDGAGADPGSDGAALDPDGAAGGQEVLLHGVPGAGLHGLGAGLEDVEPPVGP